MNTKTPAHGFCEACGRPLTDPVSLKAGIGPVCRSHGHTRRQLSIFNNRSDYLIEIAGDVICVVDLDQGGRSVTNDADGVIRDLREAGYDLSRKRVIYRDSRGVWDEMVVRNGAFAGFRSIDRRDQGEALAVIAWRMAGEEAAPSTDLAGFLAMGAGAFVEGARVTTDMSGTVTSVSRP